MEEEEEEEEVEEGSSSLSIPEAHRGLDESETSQRRVRDESSHLVLHDTHQTEGLKRVSL